MSEGNLDDLQPIGVEDNVEERKERVKYNGRILRTSEPLKDGSTSENRGHTEHMDSTEVTSSEVCCSVDTRLEENEQTALNSKDPSQNNHNSDSSSSEDETEGQGDFAANWYMPLPQDPREEEEDSEQWSEAATAHCPMQGEQDGEEEEEDQGTSAQQGEQVKAASRMEESEL